MSTLRESLQAEISTAEAELAAKKQKLADMEIQASSILNTELETVKGWFNAIKQHLGL